MKKRILADVFIVSLFFLAPWQLTAIFGIVFMLLFENYWEGIVIALVADAFYSLPESKFFSGGFGFFTLLSLLIFYLVSFVKSKIKIL